MNTTSTPNYEIRSDREQPNSQSNSVLGELFGPVDNSAASPPSEVGIINPSPAKSLLKGFFGSSSVINDDSLPKDPFSNSEQQPGNESEAGSGFFVTSGSFQPQWNGPPDVELTEQVQSAQHACDDRENMNNRPFDYSQKVLNTSPSPDSISTFMKASIADPRDPLQHVSIPRTLHPRASAQAMSLEHNAAAAGSTNQSDGCFLQYGNIRSSASSGPSRKRLLSTNGRSNDELEGSSRIFPTGLLNEGRDLIFDNECKDDSNGEEDYQPPEVGSDMDTDDEYEECYCLICNMKVGDKDSLRRHQARAHRTSEQKFRCDNCNGKFASEVNLQRHIHNVHTGEQNYACNLCSATFSTGRGLCNHKSKEHGDVPPEQGGPKRRKIRPTKAVHMCRLCSYSSNQQYNVTRHFKTVHLKQGYLQCPNRGCGRICMSKANYKTHTITCRKRPKK